MSCVLYRSDGGLRLCLPASAGSTRFNGPGCGRVALSPESPKLPIPYADSTRRKGVASAAQKREVTTVACWWPRAESCACLSCRHYLGEQQQGGAF
jgi:hypothetical protein